MTVERNLLEAATEYGAQGIAIMPCVEGGKKPALPRTGKEHAVASTDIDQIRRWWTENPRYNIGIPCTANRLAVIDIDGDAGTEWIRDNQLPMPATWTAITGNGFHYYYRWPGGRRIKTRRVAAKLEIRGAGAYVVAPPSVHPGGHIYQWAPGRGAWDALPDLLPEWEEPQSPDVGSVVSSPRPDNANALKRLAGLAKHLAETRKGNRHNTLYGHAWTLGQLVASRHLTHDLIYTALHAAAEQNGLLAEDRGNVTRTINDGIEKGVAAGPDPDHRERGVEIPYTLPSSSNEDAGEEEDDVPEIDWPTFKHEKFDNARWLIEPIIPAGSSVALYAVSKTGKSLLAFDLVAAAASGRPILGGEPLEEPIHVLYVDQEMTRREAWDRADDLGYFGRRSTKTPSRYWGNTCTTPTYTPGRHWTPKPAERSS